MNILYDNIIYSLQKSGGISVYWTQLIKRMLETGDRVVFLEYPDAKNNFLRNDVNIPAGHIYQRNTILLRFKRYLSPRLKITNNTIFHSSYYRFLKHPKVANVTSVHDFVYEHHRGGLVKYVHLLQKKYAIKNSSLIICISENTKKDLKYFFPDFPDDKIRVVYNGVSEDFFQIPALDSHPHLPFLPHSYLIYVGDRRAKYKNFETLIKCYPNNLSLLIAGGGAPTKGELRLLSKYLKPGQFKFTGHVSNTDLNIFYNHAKALVYPSCYEGFGIPIAEAQKAGCPVIALNTSSIPEVAGHSALLVASLTHETLLNAIQQLDKKTVREKIISAGLKNAERFSWDIAFAKIYDAYKEVWDKKNSL